MRRVFSTLMAILSIALLAPKAAGQCTMTHTAVDGGYILCAVGGSDWTWTGPDGFTAPTICVMASTPGTYTVRVFDGFNGVWSDPCSFTFDALPTGPDCAITGADSVCAGSSTNWCAQSGSYVYAWTGPGGFTASTECVDVSTAGAYSLTLTDATSGMSGAPCSRTLTVTSCAPPKSTSMCPAPAHWWARSCDGDERPLDAAAFARVAARVDERSAVWSYGGSADGLCALLRRGAAKGEVGVARRHYAAVLANVSAGELGVSAYDGHGVGLDPLTSLDGIRGMPPAWTVADWVASTESRLLALTTTWSRGGSAHEELHRIAKQGRAINRLAGTCGTVPSALLEDDDDDAALNGGATSWSGNSAVAGTPESDSQQGTTRLRWTLLRSATVELRVIDITGRSVRHLASGMYAAGPHEFAWDGRDDDGRTVRSGAYFVAGRVGTERLSQRLFLLR